MKIDRDRKSVTRISLTSENKALTQAVHQRPTVQLMDKIQKYWDVATFGMDKIQKYWDVATFGSMEVYMRVFHYKPHFKNKKRRARANVCTHATSECTEMHICIRLPLEF